MTGPRRFSQEWVDYFIPSTVRWDDTGFPDISRAVMRNLVRVRADEPDGITDATILDRFEGVATYKRMAELRQAPIRGNFDLHHLRRIHRHLFQDCYPWAGRLRTAPRDWPMVKFGPDVRAHQSGVHNPPEIGHRFFPSTQVYGYATAVLDRVAAKNHLKGLRRDAFVNELATVWARINYVHPFREGNTRAQFAFFTQLSHQAGYTLDPVRFQPVEADLPREAAMVGDLREKFVWGRYEYMQTGNTTLLRECLDAAIVGTVQDSDPAAQETGLHHTARALRAATAGHARGIRHLLGGGKVAAEPTSHPPLPDRATRGVEYDM